MTKVSRLSPELSAIFTEFSLTNYLRHAREVGRNAVEPRRRRALCELYNRLHSQLAMAPTLSSVDDATLRFAIDFLSIENAIQANSQPRYSAYTNMRILDRYIGVGSTLTADEILFRCRLSLCIIGRDWLQYESRAFEAAAKGRPPRKGFNSELVQIRTQKLYALQRQLEHQGAPVVRPLEDISASPEDWVHYATDGEGLAGVAHATIMPQSTWHDEYLFLRAIHLSEICFWAIITCVRAAISKSSSKQFSETAMYLREGAFFAECLVSVLNAFKTMPYESFADGFRQLTGDSSAIQSEKYHYLELITRGVNSTKREIIESYPELGWLRGWVPPGDTMLKDIVQAALESTSVSVRTVGMEAFFLERALQKWRNVHLGVVLKYLPKGELGTGRQSIHYLRRTYKDPEVGFDCQRHWAGNWCIFAPTLVRGEGVLVSALRISGLSYDGVRRCREANGDMFNEALKRVNPVRDRAFERYERVFSEYGHPFPLGSRLDALRKTGCHDGDDLEMLMSGFQLAMGVLAGGITQARYASQ